jgi:O-antigen/teichoic acid export membrane protein
LTQGPIIRASFWSLAGFGAGQFLRLVGNLILTRLLVPEAFGLMALVAIVVQGLGLLTDVGIGASIIQNKRGEEPEFLNTAWTIHVIRGIGMFACICLIAYPFAGFYGEPRLFPVVAVMSLTVLISGFNSMVVTLAGRKLWVGRVTLMNLVSQIAGIVVMVVWALVSPTVWALVAGNIVSISATAILSHMIFPWWKIRFQWQTESAREIVRFGKWMLLTSALAFLAGQIDRLTLAKLVPLHLVGIYSIGFMWATLPLQVIQAWMGRVLFPLAADIFRTLDGRDKQLKVYRRRAIWLSLLGIGLFGGLITPAYRLLYRPEYWQATQFLEIILFGALIRILDEPYRSFNLALGQPQYTFFGAAASILIFAATVYPLYGQYAAYGVAVAYSISQVGTLAVSLYGVRKAKLMDIRVDLAAVLVCFAIWGALYFATRNLL